MLTSGEIARMRTDANYALPDTAVIQAQTIESDGGGAGTTTWTASGTVACRLAPASNFSASEGMIGGRVATDSDYIITVASTVALTTDSRLVHSGGGTFNVESIMDRSWELTTRAHVTEIV